MTGREQARRLFGIVSEVLGRPALPYVHDFIAEVTPGQAAEISRRAAAEGLGLVPVFHDLRVPPPIRAEARVGGKVARRTGGRRWQTNR